MRSSSGARDGGRGVTFGESGNAWKLACAACSIGVDLVREKPLASLLLPLLGSVPLIMACNVARESLFARHWLRRLEKRSWPAKGVIGEALP